MLTSSVQILYIVVFVNECFSVKRAIFCLVSNEDRFFQSWLKEVSGIEAMHAQSASVLNSSRFDITISWQESQVVILFWSLKSWPHLWQSELVLVSVTPTLNFSISDEGRASGIFWQLSFSSSVSIKSLRLSSVGKSSWSGFSSFRFYKKIKSP